MEIKFWDRNIDHDGEEIGIQREARNQVLNIQFQDRVIHVQ